MSTELACRKGMEMAEQEEITTEAKGTSRRALLAKAAAAGAVVYTVPMVKSIPAYAAAGFDSYKNQSATCCVWFSPNQNSKNGAWHADVVNTVDGIVAGQDPGTTSMTVDVKVDGTNRQVSFVGNPNNIPGSLGKDTTEAYNYAGGGVAITSLDPNCEIKVEAVVCNPQSKAPCDPTNDTAAPTPWATGSSDGAIDSGSVAPGGCTGGDHFTGTAYYHTGRTGGDAGSNRCKLGILFRVRCK